MFKVCLFTFIFSFSSLAAAAQTSETSKPSAKADRKSSTTDSAVQTKPSAKDEKRAMDVDSFFKNAEEQTRKAQESGNSNCVPKPEPHDPVT